MGDYISREDVFLQLLKTESIDGQPRAIRRARRIVENCPAADVAEVVHASWVWNPDGMDWGIGAWVCGECKSRPETWWNTVKECHPHRCSGSHYCGNCGAKMDGGQSE